ncbi:YceI family protein [Asticcacaulis sp. AC402]|uniref:YceI family protein n=1 Tax=Asticcacaulis sp. AC402 TaxID=1282361 RepID=UPI0003C3BB21|nr:YceI family protein [Asticcacaulis sp. AC402]ESQ74228.1 polyisoprenoid-binding protein [Asticcacaulis sp. AC402]
MKRLTSLFAASIFALGLATAPAFAAETYKLDAGHTEVVFGWTHLGFSKPTGKFANAVGSITLDQADPSKSSVSVSFDISGLNTGVAALDTHLKGADFFDAAKFPTATFKSTAVQVTSAKTAKVTGDLTIHGVTKSVTLDVALNGMGEHPMKKKKAAGFQATGTIKRSDFGVGAYVPAVSDEIKLEITAEAIAE